eukprot:CAMPEP_0180381292 /NCGR_PEP_ID=MMETSP0989-20121125/26589_1 /TAXON_ID=697907 /ORGANISM="non described non described, Strain CCMP2293" /LENGTH=195 /DNA_ID=CAMNT_0022381001 /DNA_START=111 /DNA_END=699 /DNA_ORIENTATION=-
MAQRSISGTLGWLGGDGNALRAGAMDGGQLSGAVAQGARTRMPRVCRGGTGDGNDTPPGDRLLHEPRWADDGERSACRGISSRRRAAGRKAVPARAEAAMGAFAMATGFVLICQRWVLLGFVVEFLGFLDVFGHFLDSSLGWAAPFMPRSLSGFISTVRGAISAWVTAFRRLLALFGLAQRAAAHVPASDMDLLS